VGRSTEFNNVPWETFGNVVNAVFLSKQTNQSKAKGKAKEILFGIWLILTVLN
jgi:hypothetical protein